MDDLQGKILTHSGRWIDPCNLDPELICIEDIAHALSMQCRFGGHVKFHYSVARHSIFVADMVGTLEGLLHDAAEAYFIDIPSPIKLKIPTIKNFEKAIEQRIAEVFGLDYPWHPHIKIAEGIALAMEQNCVLKNAILWPTTSAEDEKLFIEKFQYYKNLKKR